MLHYYAIVQKDADSAYGVEFPDLPGCFSAADSEENIVAEATKAAALWFEDHPPVKPSSLQEVETQAAAVGAFVVLVPVAKSTPPAQPADLPR
jgi:predicted RNase H-like HicB family nuclease